jgi:hypothetical protein
MIVQTFHASSHILVTDASSTLFSQQNNELDFNKKCLVGRDFPRNELVPHTRMHIYRIKHSNCRFKWVTTRNNQSNPFSHVNKADDISSVMKNNGRLSIVQFQVVASSGSQAARLNDT